MAGSYLWKKRDLFYKELHCTQCNFASFDACSCFLTSGNDK